MRLVPIALLSVALAAPASAQSLYGPGGLFLHPTATFPPEGQITPSVLVLPQRVPGPDAVRTWISGSIDYGWTKNVEVGATVLHVTNWTGGTSGGGYLKVGIWDETKRRPAFAAGFTALGFGNFNALTAFATARKKLVSVRGRHPVFLDLGALYVDELEGIKREHFAPYGGVEIGIDRHFTFAAEGRTRMEGDNGTPWALSVLYRPNDQWRFAVTWANNGQARDPRFGFGAGLTLGSRR